MNYRKLLATFIAAGLGAVLPSLIHVFDALPYVGPALSAVVVALAAAFKPPASLPKE